MKPVLFRCQTTGQLVQHPIDDAPSGPNVYEAVLCPLCDRVHLINQATGKALGEREELDEPERRDRRDPTLWRWNDIWSSTMGPAEHD